AMARLQKLAETLSEYSQQMGKTGWRARLSFRGGKKEPPRGLYFWGGVGRGKTMLMDLFFAHCMVDEEEKKHVHFHAFMQEVHKRLHTFREAQKAGKVPEGRDPVEALSKVIVDRAWLLCFDEFHVTDIADAMILGRLFEALFERGIVVVATSNRHPSDLYKDGLQRERFLPFIDVFLEKMEAVELDNGTDYRLERLQSMDVFMTPNGADTSTKLERAFDELSIGMPSQPRKLQVNGREVDVPRAAEGVAYVNFIDLCGQPLGPGDYLAFAEYFHTLVLADIPLMGPAKRDQAKRFVTLIDALYDAKVKLVCSAEAGPTKLYTEGDGAFEFERTTSRLIEMQSPEYMALPHRG
ncbi:MAG: cell division protein ZapE, partial [Rhodospirillaceae bacterium]|nr:cell division protein ZapE [Rhodospirillaceae bacterium]